MIDEVVSAVLHNTLTPAKVTVRTELPQLLVTPVLGVAGTESGAAVPVPAGLVFPATV